MPSRRSHRRSVGVLVAAAWLVAPSAAAQTPTGPSPGPVGPPPPPGEPVFGPAPDGPGAIARVEAGVLRIVEDAGMGGRLGVLYHPSYGGGRPRYTVTLEGRTVRTGAGCGYVPTTS